MSTTPRRLIFLALIGCVVPYSQCQVVFPSDLGEQIKLKPAEECENGLNFCGDDESKYPLEDIESILNGTVELQVSRDTMKRFFGSKEEDVALREATFQNEDLEDQACGARKELMPRFTRAKNIDNKWVYLAQIGNKEFQEVEVTICLNPEKKCVNDLDSPHGEGTTLCRQIFSTQKLLALDAEGNVNVDTFELPSACVCKAKTFGIDLRTLSLPLFSFKDGFNDPNELCKTEPPKTKTLKHERFDLGPTTFDADEENGSNLINFNISVSPCVNNDTICDQDQTYPEDYVKLLMFRHKLFANREYFKTIFGQPCKVKPPEALKTRLGFDRTEKALCDSVEKYIFPKKARNSRGEWKLIVNTEDYRQGISVHRCMEQVHRRSCMYNGRQGVNPEATECRQAYSQHSLLSISSDFKLDYDTFPIPSACICHILEKDLFLDYNY